MSVTFAAVIMLVVVILVGAGGYFGLQSVKPTTATTTSCSGSGCSVTATNDATLFVPYTRGYGQAMSQVAAGLNISATVGVKGSETIRSFTVNWGDGSSSTSANPTVNHPYSAPGLYVISGNATDTKGIVHTGYGQLLPINVTPSVATIQSGFFPGLGTSFGNGTAGGVYPWVTVGSTVTVNGTYVRAPANPFYTAQAPTLTAGAGVTQKSSSGGATWVTGTFTLNSPGTDQIVLTAKSANGTAAPVSLTYTWNVYVAPAGVSLGCAACSAPAAKSPHPNQIVYYLRAAGGPITIDPAASYYAVDYDVDAEFTQTLVQYNGTDVGPGALNYVPEVATCVAGTPQCADLYGGNNLVQGNNYTFVISSADKFYDPDTGKSWNIYPSDVYFSFLRGLAFADLPSAAIYAGWIEAQMLLPNGNPSWDTSIHFPYNTTPQNMLDSMLINDSAFCPAAAMSGGGSGCITFVADANGLSWPAIMSYLSIPSVGAVTPCSWYSYHGATVPGFMGTQGASQALATDTGCLLPGGATTTSATSFKNWVATQGPTSWDSYEGLGTTNYPSPNPSVQWIGAGSGPYYVAALDPGVSVTYEANPAYVQPVGCAGESYCQPVPGSFAKTVDVYWEDSDTVGVQELSAGYADAATIESANMPVRLKLVEDGIAGFINQPTLGVYNWGINTAIDIASLKTIDPDPVNIQSNSLAYNGLRGFLETAYPYSTVQAQYNVINGVQLGFNYGGFIPDYMANYYPTNVSWPNFNTTTGVFSNPSSDASSVGSAAWYFAQMTDPSSPLYDPQFGTGGYSASNPLHIPVLFQEGDPTHQAVALLWGSFASQLSHGAVVFDIFPVAPSIVYGNLLPSQCPWGLAFIGWAPDYAQPYDYWAAYGAPSGGYSGAFALAPTFAESQFNNPSCDYTTASSFASLAHWGSQPYIADDCQGPAYNASVYFANIANNDANIAQGQLYWNLIDSIFSHLNLEVNTEQSNQLFTYAAWINPASINVNLINGEPGEMYLWYGITGNGVV